jgi:hypothetical protein
MTLLPHCASLRLRGVTSCFLCLTALDGSVPKSARALSFNLSFDSSMAAAPAGFSPAFNDAIQFYETHFTDPITINLQVGWGTINNQIMAPGPLGESGANGNGFIHFSQVKAALVGDAKSANDLTSVANMPAADPTGGANFVMARAEAKAMGLLAGNAQGIDGYVGFSSTAAFTFDPNNRATAGKYDFIGVAEHEISETMGRFGLGQNGVSSGRYGPIDLFRYLSHGVLDLMRANGAYFSIDGGTTTINTFNGTSGGDLSDWAGATIDSYNAGPTIGKINAVSAGDLTVMDVIGYDVLSPGDFNRDGQVTVADIQAMSTALADLSGYESQKGLTDSQLQLLGDLNGDGQITNADIQALLNLIANTNHGAGTLAAVPEPPTAWLMLIAMVAGAILFRNASAARCAATSVKATIQNKSRIVKRRSIG